MRIVTRTLSILAAIGLLLVFRPLPASAEQVVAVIIPGDLPRYQQIYNAMSKVLSSGGYDESRVKYFVQKPNTDKMSLINSLRRGQAAGATVIVTFGSRLTDLARLESLDTPVLFADVYDPVALGVVSSLATPTANASGATSNSNLGILVNQLLALRKLNSVGLIYTSKEAGSIQQRDELQALGQQHGFQLIAESAPTPEIAVALAEKLAGQCEALFLTESLQIAPVADQMVETAQARKCAVFSQIPGLVDAGALIGLEADLDEQGILIAVHTLQLLQGQKIRMLPIRQGSKITLKINRDTAKQLGINLTDKTFANAVVVP